MGQGTVRKAIRLLTGYDQYLSHKFEVRDANHSTMVTKTWGGFIKAAFTTADNYGVGIPHPLPDPLASMVAAALTIGTALKQDSE